MTVQEWIRQPIAPHNGEGERVLWLREGFAALRRWWSDRPNGSRAELPLTYRKIPPPPWAALAAFAALRADAMPLMLEAPQFYPLDSPEIPHPDIPIPDYLPIPMPAVPSRRDPITPPPPPGGAWRAMLVNTGFINAPGLPVKIMAIEANGTAALGRIFLYDGMDSNDPERAMILVPTNQHLTVPLPNGWDFQRGLYVVTFDVKDITFIVR